MSISARLAGLSALVLLTGCASVGPREPVKFEGAARPAGSERFPNWIEPPDEAMRLMVTAPPKVLSLAPTATGTSGAEKVAVDLGGDDYKIKAKKVPPDLDGVNNAPPQGAGRLRAPEALPRPGGLRGPRHLPALHSDGPLEGKPRGRREAEHPGDR